MGIEPGTSWMAVRCANHYTKQVVSGIKICYIIVKFPFEGKKSTIAPKLLYGRKECDLAELLTPLAIHTLLYSRK